MSQIIAGVDGSERASDAVALATAVARTARAELLIAHAHPVACPVMVVPRSVPAETTSLLGTHTLFPVAAGGPS